MRVKTSKVTHPVTKAERNRPWTLPLLTVCCSQCGFPAVAVSAEAADLAVWDHVAYRHLGMAAVAAEGAA